MPNRTAKFAAIAFVNVLASFPLVTLARAETAAPDNCLSAPKGETPAGSRWRYRVDHVNKRNCWYLRPEGGAQAQASPQNGTAVFTPPAKPSVSDARAEFRPPDNTLADPSGSQASPSAGSSASETSSASASIWNAAPPVATRWPDVPVASSSANPAPAAPPPVSEPTQASAEPGQPAHAVAPSAPVANPPAPIQPETLRTLIAAALSALAFAGAAALIVRRRGLGRRLRRRVAQSARGPIWETTDDDRIILSDHRYQDMRDYRPRFARGAGVASTSSNRKPESSRRAPRYAQR